MITTGRVTCLVTTVLLLAACSHTAPSQMVDVGDNTRGWRVTCGGLFSATGDCYDKASYLCMNRGYAVLKETDITPPQSSYFWNSAGAHEIVVKCNTPA